MRLEVIIDTKSLRDKNGTLHLFSAQIDHECQDVNHVALDLLFILRLDLIANLLNHSCV